MNCGAVANISGVLVQLWYIDNGSLLAAIAFVGSYLYVRSTG